MSNLINTNNYTYRKDNWWFLGELPSKNGRYIVLDTETTGFSAQYNNVIELAAVEISKGKLTGVQYHAYIKPRTQIDPRAEEKHKMGNNFYQDFYSDVYHSDKQTMENFLKFVGHSIIFAHNASFDYHFVNNELKYWKLPLLPKNRFRCTMRIFKTIFSQVDINFKKYCSLAKCCDYFGIKSSKYNFHTAIFDSFMTARLLGKIYEYVENKNNIESIKAENKAKVDVNIETFSNSETGNEKNEKSQDIIEDINREIYVGVDLHSNTNNNLNDNNEEMNDFVPDQENFDPNTLDQDMLMIQEYEGFINSYMNDQNHLHEQQNLNINEEQNYDVGLKECNFDNNANIVNNGFIFETSVNNKNIHSPELSQNQCDNINQQTSAILNGSSSLNETRHNKYKDLMRKYLNTYNKTNDIRNSVDKMREESKEEIFQLSSEDIEEIIKDNI